MMQWIAISNSSEYPIEQPFLLMDEYENVYVGSTSFDFYDAKYWCPMPTLPMKGVITNDDWVNFIEVFDD